MQADDVRGLSDAELAARIAELEEERFRLRFRGATQPLEDPLRLRAIRKDVARLKTIQRERALGVKRETAVPAASTTTRGRTTATRSAGATKKTTRRTSR
jgi:large subunit ribosomal protein L29